MNDLPLLRRFYRDEHFNKPTFLRIGRGVWLVLGPCYPHGGEAHSSREEAVAAYQAHATLHAARTARRQHREN